VIKKFAKVNKEDIYKKKEVTQTVGADKINKENDEIA
jgi:hypothetical protein